LGDRMTALAGEVYVMLWQRKKSRRWGG